MEVAEWDSSDDRFFEIEYEIDSDEVMVSRFSCRQVCFGVIHKMTECFFEDGEITSQKEIDIEDPVNAELVADAQGHIDRVVENWGDD